MLSSSTSPTLAALPRSIRPPPKSKASAAVKPSSLSTVVSAVIMIADLISGGDQVG